VVDQIDQEFVPYIKAVLVGTPIDFSNNDGIRHRHDRRRGPHPFLEMAEEFTAKAVIITGPVRRMSCGN
jgi:hypothetical protein